MSSPFNDFLGTEIRILEEGQAEVTLDLAPHHLNRRGVAHGGVISSLLDAALGAAVISAIPRQWWCATTSLSTQFIGGGADGPLVARGRLQRRGVQVAFAEGEVRDGRGRLVAKATGTWHLWTQRPDRPSGVRRFVSLPDGERVRVGKIVAVGRNYAEHVREMNAPQGAPPVVFFKPATALLHDGDRMQLPPDVGEVHHEVEMVVVIGRSGRAIPVERAMEHVLGYAVGLDMTLREVQGRAKKRGEPWCVAKGFDGSAPVSDVAAREAVGDGSGLDISLSINGEVRQQGNTSQMLNSVPELIAQVSSLITLERGDLLFTGTPAGVGPVRPGDHLEARLEKVGTLGIDVA